MLFWLKKIYNKLNTLAKVDKKKLRLIIKFKREFNYYK